ncbi:hypothetical protein SLS56_010882 [Neofusicoccum ribis]|uniref:Heterokaryon incompatibility domain-containing protein n=1 Tax=Neofusicoccum ribis TaxID=45134 RepID=A0ABR3SD55_9PEZI
MQNPVAVERQITAFAKKNDVDDNSYDTGSGSSSDGPLEKVDDSHLFAMVDGDTRIRMDDLKYDLDYLMKSMRESHVIVDTVALQRRGLLDQPSTEVGVFISEAEYHWHTKEKTEKEHDENVEDGSLNLLSVLVQVGDSEPFKLWFKISAPRDPCATWLSIRGKPPLQFNGNEQRLRYWVAKHTKFCRECQKAPQQGQPPTRLIDVGTPSGNEEPRLIITDEHDIHKRCGKALPGYLILSYCWGENSDNSSATTTKNFPDYQKAMSMDIFPATCRDAIRVTRSLGFRYLWIDAFCIIQDDEEDWHREAGRMVDAYKNAFLTIVPLQSQSAHDGLLNSSPSGAIIPFESRVVQGLQGKYWVHEIQPGPKDLFQSPFKQRVSLSDASHEMLVREEHLSKWQTRAWTFQEDLACQKALIFGIESTYFKCGREVYKADGEAPFTTVRLDGPGHYLELPEENKSKKDILGRFWYRLIHSYMKREITHQNDRLPAISSLARTINEALPEEDQYVAGLFSSDLPRGLLWQNKPGSKAHGFDDHLEQSFFTRPSYVSPSWSWASSPGNAAYSPLTWLNTRFEELHCGIHAEVEVRPENPYGKVENATLVVTSKTYSCNSRVIQYRPDDDDELVLEDDEGFQAHLSMDWAIRLPENDKLCVSSSTPYDSKCGPLHNMHLIPLLVSDPAMARSRDGHQQRLYGLIVVPNPDPESKGSWIRAGVFTSYEREGCQKAKAYFGTLEEKTFKIV